MPDYPTFVLVSLQEINGNSCGTLEQRCQYVIDSNPPEYNRTSVGDMPVCNLKRVTLSGGVLTWDLTTYVGSGICFGYHAFRRTTAADDPTGNYCKRTGSMIDCDAGKAAVVDDD